MRNVFGLLLRHWRMFAVLIGLLAGGTALAVSPHLRNKAHAAWHATLAWAGVTETAVDSSKVFWCPMHPPIKSNKENYVCPICNMALVELEGGIVEAPEHLTLHGSADSASGVVTKPVMRRELYREIDTTGRIDYDERRLSKITSWISGKSRIEKLHVNYKGIHVHKVNRWLSFTVRN